MMSATGFDVSVIIPTHDRVRFLLEAIRSCVGQQGCRVEILVVDDGSQEPIARALEAAFGELMEERATGGGDIRVVHVRQQHLGVCVARNTGLERATGEFVKFLDSDDILLPDTLVREVEVARSSGADAVITGWEEHRLDTSGREVAAQRRKIVAPDLSRGIDDMLLGRAPCVSAALYRRAFVRVLQWNPAWEMADDWGWALTVCLAGARFVSLQIASFAYRHHAGERATSQSGAVWKMTVARQRYLRMIEDRLREQEALTPERQRMLAQYYYRDRQVICQRSPRAWSELWRHCRELAPGFRPGGAGRVEGMFVRGLGIYVGIRCYVALKRVAGSLLRIYSAR